MILSKLECQSQHSFVIGDVVKQIRILFAVGKAAIESDSLRVDLPMRIHGTFPVGDIERF